MKNRIAIVGGGASGLIASIYASSPNTEVTLFERNAQCGKKLLLTGNGKCNLWNEDQTLKHYHSFSQKNLDFLFSDENQSEILSFFQRLGIVFKIKNGYFYPQSGQAITVREALLREAKRKHVQICCNFDVTKIESFENYFVIQDQYVFDQVILATGSCAYPKTGSNGSGYVLAKSLFHTITPIVPSLTPLILKGNFTMIKGIRLDVRASIWENNQCFKEEEGELLFTDLGVSGICIFNLSRYASIGLNEQKKMILKLNLVPFLKENPFSFFDRQDRSLFLSEILDGFFPYQFTNYFLKTCHFKQDEKWSDLSVERKKILITYLQEFSFDILDTKGFESAQVTSGGVSLQEVDSQFQSVLKKGLYFTGELLDVDGDCGGYNLSFAWLSGMVAGKSAQMKEK